MGVLKIDTDSGPVQLITSNIEDTIPAGAVILKGNLRRQLHDLLFGKALAQPRVQIAGDDGRCGHHRIGQFQRQPFDVTER